MNDIPGDNKHDCEATDWIKARDTYAIKYCVSAVRTEYWRVTLWREGKRRQKTFSFLKLGGREAAYAAAIAWRDDELNKKPAMTIKAFATLRRSNNISGVPGVTFLRSPSQPAGFWQAGLTLKDGTRRRKSFGVATLGHHEAYRRAVQARLEMVAAAQDRPFVRNPYAQIVAQAAIQTQTLANISRKPARRRSTQHSPAEAPAPCVRPPPKLELPRSRSDPTQR